MNKEEAIAGLNRVGAQKAKLAGLMQKTMHVFMKPETRDQTARELENKEKAMAVLWLSIEIQETIKNSLLKRGVPSDAVENSVRLFRQDARGKP